MSLGIGREKVTFTCVSAEPQTLAQEARGSGKGQREDGKPDKSREHSGWHMIGTQQLLQSVGLLASQFYA